MKKFLSILLSLGLACSLFAGCGNEQAPTTQNNETSKNDTQQTKTTEITWWAFPTFAKVDDISGKYEEQLAQKFMEANPNIKVTVEMIDFQNGPEKLTAAIQGGTAPDILFDAPGRIMEYASSGTLVNLDDMFTADFKADITSEGLLSSCSDGKNYYMYPISAAPFTMALNKTILEKEGLLDMAPVDGDRTWTTEEFIALSKALQEKGYKGAEIYCGGQGGDQGTRAFISNLTGATIMDAGRTKYTMDTKEGIDAVKMILDGIDAGYMSANPAGVANDALDHFDQGQVAISILWGPGLAKGRESNLKQSGIEALSVSLPSPTGKPSLEYLINGFCVFDNGDADKIAASKEFIKFLCDDEVVGKENVVATGCFPVRKSFGNLYGDDKEMAYYSELSKYYGTYYNTVPGFASMRPFWWGSLQSVFTKDKTPEEAMKYFVEESNKTLTE